MKQNLTNTDERGVKINDLQGKTHRLQNESYNFRTSAKKVKRQMCISNMKWWFVLIGVVIVVIIIAVGKFPSQTLRPPPLLRHSSQPLRKQRRSTKPLVEEEGLSPAFDQCILPEGDGQP